MPSVRADGVELKFNPYHDPRNGRFTFAPGGPRSLSRVVITRRRAPYVLTQNSASPDLPGIASDRGVAGATPDLTKGRKGKAVLEGLRDSAERVLEPARKVAEKISGEVRAISDEIRSIYDLLPNETEWQGLPLLVVPDQVLDTPRTTTDEAKRIADMVMTEVERFVPPEYIGKLDIRVPIDDAAEFLRDVRMIRAAAAIKFKNDFNLMEIETMRLMQDEADAAFAEANALIARGVLRIRISREITVGNYIDAKVRKALRRRYASLDIVESNGGQVRVNRRELEAKDDERSYRRPDAHVGSVSFDVTLTRKTNTTPQILGFF